MQITVSSEIAKRMDDSSSTRARAGAVRYGCGWPWTVSDMETDRRKKRAARGAGGSGRALKTEKAGHPFRWARPSWV
ncbi:hypothetical protein AVXHC19_10020 [Acidovorax sacchari]